MWGKPALGVLVVEGPRRNDGKKGKGGAGEADVKRKRNVLGHEANEEGEDLETFVNHLRPASGTCSTYSSRTEQNRGEHLGQTLPLKVLDLLSGP